MRLADPFITGTFNPEEKVTVNRQRITFAQYAARMNIKLLRPADFNVKLREHRIDKKVTVQKICKVCRNKRDVRAILDEIWQNSSKAKEVLSEALSKNQNVFEFEKALTN